MNQRILIKNTTIVNEGKSLTADVLLSGELIQQIGNIAIESNHKVIDGTGKH
ncbi:MAG: dihydroorotase, partial [Patescibacteria group bacterium]